MSEIRTLGRSHPDFEKYLLGTFSSTERAVPLRSLNLRSEKEAVSFRILPLSQIRRPAWLTVWLKALRPRVFLTVLFPVLLVVVPALSAASGVDPLMALVSVLGVLFAFSALILRNDFQDHLSGLDRLHPDRGSRAIQNGWLPARTIGWASMGFAAVAILIAGFVFWIRPQTAMVLVPAAALAWGAFFLRSRSFKDLPAGELLVAVLGGPCLVAGLQLAILGSIQGPTLAAGFLWGWLFLFPVHLKNFEHLLIEGQARVPSLIARAGFDRGQKMIRAWWALGFLGFVGLHVWTGASLGLWALTFLLAVQSLVFFRRFAQLQSPLGSEVATVRRQGQLLLLSLTSIWVLEILWRSSL